MAQFIFSGLAAMSFVAAAPFADNGAMGRWSGHCSLKETVSSFAPKG